MSEGRPTFIQGLDRVTPKEAKRFVARAERLKKEGLKPKEQEFEKTPEQQRDIILLNSFLAAEFVDLGVENFETFEPERVHIVSHEKFKKMKSARSHGLYFAIHHSVFLKQDFLGEREHHASMWLDKQEEEMAQNILEAEWEGIEGVVIETSLDLYPLDETKTEDHPVNLAQKQKRDKYIAQTRRIFFKQIPQLRKRYAFLSTLSHEMVHAASETTLFIEDRGLDERRGGFQNYNDRTKQASFVGLNEAVVQKMSWQILLRNHDVLDKEDGKRLGDLTKFLVESGVGMFEEDFSFYDDYIIVLDAIIKGVAEVRGMTFEEVWREFKTSYLKGGKLDFLKDLEQIFGRYSFKILSKLNEKNSSLVGDYFREKDSEKRREIGQKILEG